MKKFLFNSSFLVCSFFFFTADDRFERNPVLSKFIKNKKIRSLSGFLFRYAMFLINLHLRTLSSPKRLQLTIIY